MECMTIIVDGYQVLWEIEARQILKGKTEDVAITFR